MLFILAAAMLGGAAALVLTLPASPILALVVTPVAGSAAALGAALILARRRGPSWQNAAEPEARTGASHGFEGRDGAGAAPGVKSPEVA